MVFKTDPGDLDGTVRGTYNSLSQKLKQRIRKVGHYLALVGITSLPSCGDGPTAPPKPIGAPTASASFDPQPSRGVYNGRIIFDGTPGTNGEIILGRVDTNLDGQPDTDIAPNQLPFYLGVSKDNRSDSTQNYSFMGIINGTGGKADTARATLSLPPSNAPTLSVSQIPSQVFGRIQVPDTAIVTPDLGRIVDRAWRVYVIDSQRDSSEVVNTARTPGAFTAIFPSNYENLSGTTQNGTRIIVGRDELGKVGTITTPISVQPYIIFSRTITDILSGQPIQGVILAAGGDTATSDANGIANVNKGTRAIDSLIVSDPLNRYQRRLTFPAYGTNITLISSQPDPLHSNFTIIQSFNQVARTRVDGRDTATVHWPPNSNPIYVIETPGFDQQTLGFIKDVSQNDFEKMTRGYVRNAASFYETTIPTDSIGRVTFRHANFNGAQLLIVNNQIVGIIAYLSNGITRGVTAHEAVGHGSGQVGHTDVVIGGSILDFTNSAQSPSAYDTRNADMLYQRPVNSGKPDDDRRPAGTATASSNLYNNNMRVTGVREPADFGVPQTQNTNIRPATATGASANNVPAQVARQPVLERVVANHSYQSSGSFRDRIYKAISDIFLNLPH